MNYLFVYLCCNLHYIQTFFLHLFSVYILCINLLKKYIKNCLTTFCFYRVHIMCPFFQAHLVIFYCFSSTFCVHYIYEMCIMESFSGILKHLRNSINSYFEKETSPYGPVSSSITVLHHDQNGFKTHLTPKVTISLFLHAYNYF